jgi:hypothetical protein
MPILMGSFSPVRDDGTGNAGMRTRLERTAQTCMTAVHPPLAATTCSCRTQPVRERPRRRRWCEKTPKWDPCRNWGNILKQLKNSVSAWGPSRCRSGPHSK